MNKGIILLFFLFLSSAVKAGFFYRDVEFLEMKNFSAQRSNGEILVKFDYVINNPNWYSIVIRPSKFKLKIGGVECGDVTMDSKNKIRRKKRAAYPFQIRGRESDFKKSAFSSLLFMLTKKSIRLDLEGKLKVRVMFVFLKQAVKLSENITLEQLRSIF